MASTTIAEISRLDLQELRVLPSAVITDVKHLSSYNWIEAPKTTPTIAVPGSPALWAASSAPQKLQKDSGLIYIAQNAARHPDSPLEPLFRALYITNPSFDICSTDVVTDRNNIRKLLSFVNPGLTRNELESFTINIEVVKNTVILCREETATYEYIGPHEFRGFGHEFEKAYTTSQISGSTGHHRIISYRLGDLNFIVRHETDGYVDTDTKSPTSNSKELRIDTLSSALGSLSLSLASEPPTIVPTGSKLRVKEEGQVIPIESTIEIKTRVFHKPLMIQDLAPQLWISQTPKLVRAYHDKGAFKRPEVEDVAHQIRTWEERSQSDLRRLTSLIRKIIDTVKGSGGNAVLKYEAKSDKLVIRKADAKKTLPKDLYLKWEIEDNSEADPSKKNDDLQETERDQTKKLSVSEPSHSTATAISSKTTITVGSVDYSLHLSKVPYLSSFVRLQKTTEPKKNWFIHGPIPLFDVALKGIESGYRQCFRSLPADLSQHRTLCETYKFLEVDVLGDSTTNEVIQNLKTRREYYDTEYSRYLSAMSGKQLARDTAFQLLFLMLTGEIEDQTKDNVRFFNAVLFVVSHPGTFKHRTRQVIWDAYKARFNPTLKQRIRLAQWETRESANNVEDVTTEEDPDYDYYFNSDYDYYVDSDYSW